MGATAAVHPTDQNLQAYGLGKLDDAAAESLHKHLESCADCRNRVAEVSSDSFLNRLRDVQARPELPGPGPVVSSIAGLSMLDTGAGAAAPPAAETLPPGLADHPDYEVIRELGQGGMGTVYLAQNRLMGRHEVLKVVSSHLIRRRGVLDRFLIEIRNAARLHHTNIVTAYSASRLGESIIFAMEYVEGLDLAKLVKAKGPLPVANACSYVHQACLGLQHAHEHRMVHRDIKPSNLMLAREGNRAIIKVLDFGLAKMKSEGPTDGALTQEGQMLGTPDYIAPEQIRDARGSDIRADIYSMGCTLYYLLTGGPPFPATSLYELLQAHHSMDATPLNLARPAVPVELAALVAKMMAKEPERRFQEPKEVAQALTPFFKKGAVAAAVSTAEVSRVRQPSPKQGIAEVASQSTQPATSRAPAAASPVKKPPGTTLPEAKWESLIEFKQTEPVKEPAPVVAAAGSSRPPWIRPAVAVGVLTLGLFAAWLGGVFKVKTPDGVIVLENVPKDSEILVDGNKITVTWPGVDKPIEIRAVPGQHKVEVKKDRVTMFGDVVTVKTGDSEKVTVHLEPPAAVQSGTKEADAAVAKARQEPVLSTEVASSQSTAGHAAKRNILADATIIRGTWRIEGDELVQSDDQLGASLAFGDAEWSDYDLTLEAKKVSGRGHGFHVLFHRLSPQRFCWYGLGVFDNAACEMCFFLDGQRSRAGDINKDNWAGTGVNLGQWYFIKIKVRKSKFECYLNNDLMFEESHASFSHGRIGLSTGRIQAKFRHIKVTDPEGKVLFEGLPDVGSANEAAGGIGGSPGVATDIPAGNQITKPSTRSVERIGTISLFNGKDTREWKDTIQNGSKWEVVNGLLEGHGGGSGKPAVLVSQRQNLTEFRLRAQVRYPANGSGWIELRRSEASGKSSGYFVSNGVRPVRGIPFGGVTKATNFQYGKGIGWDFRSEAIPFPANTWATIDITVSEDRIAITVNGKRLSEYTDVRGPYRSGGIALFCQGDAVVQYRSITIEDFPSAGGTGDLPTSAVESTAEPLASKPQEPPSRKGTGNRSKNVLKDSRGSHPNRGWTPLFNGKDLTGWKDVLTNGSEWKVVGGLLEGHGTGQPGGQANLVTQRQNFTNYRLHTKFRYQQEGWGSIELRLSLTGSGENRNGYLVDQGLWPRTDPWQIPVGSITKMKNHPPHHLAWETTAEASPVPVNTWNDLDIVAVRDRITTSVNGKKVADYTDASGWYGSGAISLLVGAKSAVQFKEIMIEELPD